MKNHKFIPLKPSWPNTLAATIKIACKITHERLTWNDAVLAGWSVDSNGTPFDSYYSPQGRQAVESDIETTTNVS